MNIKNKKLHGFKKFLILLSILIAYMLFVIIKFGIQDGLAATALTWAFFVTCTPIADAGFIVDFPVRLLFNFKMFYTEMIVWLLALAIIVSNYLFSYEIFNQLEILKIFKEVIENPWPLWSIVVVSAIGTFLSIYTGDHIYNMVQQKKHHHHIKIKQIQRLLLEIFMFTIIVSMYFWLLKLTGISIG